jgi:hypothetical protein
MATRNLIQFVIRNGNSYLKIGGGIYWVAKDEANKYPSRYAAKRHLEIMAIHDEVKIEEYVK